MHGKILLALAFASVSSAVSAQSSRSFAITGKENNKFFWADIKEVDLATGRVVRTLFEADRTPFSSTNLDAPKGMQYQQEGRPTAFGVAAAAFDARNNRLYFAPMHFGEIRYLDLSSEQARFSTVKQNILPAPTTGYLTEESHITRMVIAADGYGYAITNDGNHLIRFSTGKNSRVEDLGNLVDAETNKGISIHSKCTGWGGDMVADAFGKLVVVSANHHVFSVDPSTRITTHIGTIQGLPAGYTTNGAVVDEDGQLVVSSANVFDGLFRVNMRDFSSTKIVTDAAPFNASDLANGNMLRQKDRDAMVKADAIRPLAPATGSIYPNPVTDGRFNVAFRNQKAGRYTVILSDMAGRVLQSNVIEIATPDQVASLRMARKFSKGVYLIRVINDQRSLVFSDKLIVE
jgi:hypothetical protein